MGTGKVKRWKDLTKNQQSYWILIYKGYSKLNGFDPVPKPYIKHILKHENNDNYNVLGINKNS